MNSWDSGISLMRISRFRRRKFWPLRFQCSFSRATLHLPSPSRVTASGFLSHEWVLTRYKVFINYFSMFCWIFLNFKFLETFKSLKRSKHIRKSLVQDFCRNQMLLNEQKINQKFNSLEFSMKVFWQLGQEIFVF